MSVNYMAKLNTWIIGTKLNCHLKNYGIADGKSEMRRRCKVSPDYILFDVTI